MDTKPQTIFRAKSHGKGLPRVGIAQSVQPGDWLEFNLGGPIHGRFVASVHKDHVVTRPLKSKYGLLDGSHKVLYTAFYSVTRHQEPQVEPEIEFEDAEDALPSPTPEPSLTPEPVSKSPTRAPEPEPEPETKAKRQKKQPPPSFLDFLDSRYKGSR